MTSKDAVAFPLARRRIRLRAVLRLVLGLALIAVALLDLLQLAQLFGGLIGGGGPLRLWMLPLVGGLYLAAQGGLRLAAIGGAAIRLEADGLWLPAGIATLRGRTVAYGDIELLMAQSRGGRGRVIIGTRARVHVVDALDIGGMLTLKSFHDQLRAHIAASGVGSAHLERVDRGLAVTRTLMGRRARVTEIILTVLIAAYVAELAMGAVGPFGLVSVELLEMIRMGAIVPWLIVEQGQWFRLVTGTVLHAGLIHVAVNGMALLALGGLLERLIGGYRLAIIYVVSALAGSLASAFVSEGWLSVGASGAVFGLLGAFAVLQLRHGRRLPPGIAQSRRWWLFILGLNGALPIALPMIDVWAHVGGFVGGAAAAGVLLFRVDAIRSDRPTPFLVQAVGMVLVGLAAAGLALGINYTRSADRWMTEELRAVVAQSAADADLLNMLAWTLVIDADAPSHMLELGLEAADAGLAKAPDKIEIRDTRATALYRLRRTDEAIADERVVLDTAPTAYYATQLLRFVEAARQGRQPPPDGPLRGPDLADEDTWAAISKVHAPLLRDGDDLTWSYRDLFFRKQASYAGPPPDIEVLAAWRVDGVARGLIRARMRWHPDQGYTAERGEGQVPPEGGVAVPLYVDRVMGGDGHEANRWRFWESIEAVTTLP